MKQPASISKGDTLLLQGVLSPEQTLMWQKGDEGLVICQIEHFTGTGKHNGWSPETKYMKEFMLSTPNGSMYQVSLKEIPDRGRSVRRIKTDQKTDKGRPVQLKGLGIGDSLSVIGIVEEAVAEPYTIRGLYSYGGGVESYNALLAQGEEDLGQYGIYSLLAGMALLGWGGWQAESNKRKGKS